MIGIIDYGMGNLLSVYHAVDSLGAEVLICDVPEDLQKVERIILPGVGAFDNCLKNLSERNFLEAINEAVICKGKPIMGICLGMQVMARRSFEGGEFSGLGWFDADVVRLQPTSKNLRVPHIGWNEISYRLDSPLFYDLPPNPDFYFVHSFFMKCDHDYDIEASCDHGGIFPVAVRKNNIFATQFHPEKSQEYGQKVIANFLSWKP